jgi:hypothetical protein
MKKNDRKKAISRRQAVVVGQQVYKTGNGPLRTTSAAVTAGGYMCS